MSETVLLGVADGIATIRLNRPDVGNSIDATVARALLDIVRHCDSDSAVRCLILTGVGKMFCAGGDVHAFVKAADGVRQLIDTITTPLHEAIVVLSQTPKPIITAINGAAAGAGLGLALLGDVAIAARSAKFSAGYGAIGVTPDAGVTWLLPKLVGLRKAQQLLIGGERIDSQEAERIGLVSKTVDDLELQDVAHALADRMKQQSGSAVMTTRNLIYQGYHASLADQLVNEAVLIGKAAESKDGREGALSFVEKRRPTFEA